MDNLAESIEALGKTAESIINGLRDDLKKESEAHQKSVDDLLLHVHEREAYIDRLRSEFKDCVNELCLQCGRYKTEHLGSCDDCRWKKPRKSGGYID